MTVLADYQPCIPSAIDPMALALNENPYPPLPAVHAAIVRSLDAANRYPEFLPERLRHLIAGRIGVPEGQIILGAGATGVMLQVLHAITDPGDRIVMADPVFEGYPIISAMNRLETVQIPLTRTGHQNLSAMASEASQARVVAICRPHNPTGTVESRGAIEEFLTHVPSHTVVILDEAYVEFVAPAHRIDSASLVERFPNVVVLRTFSKAYGLAGLRIGYGFGSPQLAAALWAMQLPFGISITSLVAVAASFTAEAQLQRRIRTITAERQYLCSRLHEMGIDHIEGHANFVYLPPAGIGWQDAFADTGVRVKHCSDGGVRLSVGERSSTEAVVAALRARIRGRAGQPR